VNPTTKLRMLVPPKLVLNFRPVASIKEKLKNGGEDND
jgi:nucleoid DNA-binding protein